MKTFLLHLIAQCAMHMLYFEQDLVIMVIFSELRLYLDKIGDADLLNCVQALMQPSRR